METSAMSSEVRLAALQQPSDTTLQRVCVWPRRYGDFATVFAFASPQNQAATGPVERFASMLRTPAYAPLIGHSAASIVTTMQVMLLTLLVLQAGNSMQVIKLSLYVHLYWHKQQKVVGRANSCSRTPWIPDASRSSS